MLIRDWLLIRLIIILGLCCSLHGLGSSLRGEQPATGSQPAAPSSQQIQSWIQQLDSDRYLQRTTATDNLLASGKPIIKPLLLALPNASLERITRIVFVLRELALSEDFETEQAARKALLNISSLSNSAAARRAADTLARLDKIRKKRAGVELQQLGAIIGISQQEISLRVVIDVQTVEIGDQWKGKADDLKRLKWLDDVQQVVMSGPQINDAALGFLADMKNLDYIIIKRANISDAGMKHLTKMASLRRLSIMYCPIGNASIDYLKVHKKALRIELYGTKISRQGAQQLQKELATVKIDFRQGAFLGIGCDPQAPHCLINNVHANSAAAKAGLQSLDIIVKYNDQKITTFESLTVQIAKNTAGDMVEMTIIRGNKTLLKKVTLGEWD